MEKLVLFDLDKTLLFGIAAHRKAFHGAFREIYGVDTTIDIIDHQGMTDQQIIIEVLKKLGFSDAEIKPKLKECMLFMAEEFERAVKQEDIVPLPGARELLGELSKRNVLLGMVTGNLERIAWCKLQKAGLKHYFKFGAFGSDAIHRSDLVKLALERARRNFGFRFNDNAFLFGDTPRDMDAGREAGVKTVGVATGDFSTEQLKEAGADFVLENLKDTKRILEVIFGY
jgi:phosphoglycolate phosphatase-like HAD superfamily hydrolase